MQPNDFVYMQIYKGAMKAGATERAAKDHAVMGLNEYKSNRFGQKKVSGLIDWHIKQAKKKK